MRPTDSSVFITGGSGFMASYLVKSLPENQPIVLHARDPLKLNPTLKGPRIRVVSGSLGDKRLASEIPENCQVLVHLAGAAQGPNTMSILSNNVVSVLQSLELMESRKIPTMIFMSTAAVWDDGFGRQFDEQVEPAPSTPYGYAKLTAETLLHDALDRNRLRAVVSLRCNNTYGYGSVQGVVANFFNRILHDRPVQIEGDGQQLREPVYVTDVIDVLIKSMSPAPGYHVYGISGPEPVTVRQMAETIAETLGKELAIDWRPARADRSRHLQVDCQKALRELGWSSQVKFADGVKLMCREHFSATQSKDTRLS